MFFHQYRSFFADFRKPCWFLSLSPHRGMWATFWRIGANVGRYENARGDLWWGRPVRCIAEGVVTSTPSASSISQPPNSIFVTIGAFESRRNIWFRRSHPLSLPTTTQAGEPCRFAAHIHPHLWHLPWHPHLTPYRRNCDAVIRRTHGHETRLPWIGLQEFLSSSVCIRSGDAS